MKLRTHDLINIHLPRWDEFPAFELYIDQVISFINERLELFNRHSEEPLLTASMINNYVKNGAIPAPIKKKYNREHLAKLVVICVGKRMLSLADLTEAIATMSRKFDTAEGYDIFCDEIEYEVLSTFAPDEYPPRTIVSSDSREVATMRSLASAVAKILVFDRIVGQRRRLSNLTGRILSDSPDNK